MRHDLLHAWRAAVRNWRFSLVFVLGLGIAIGAATAVFTVIDVLLFRPITSADSQRIVRLETENPAGFDMLAWWSELKCFESLASYRTANVNISQGGYSEPALAAIVSPSFMTVLRVTPLFGRGFGQGDTSHDDEFVAILSYGAWVRWFDRSEDVLGQHVVVDRLPFTIVGVMPARFSFPEGADVWLPRKNQTGGDTMLGRLRQGLSLPAARTEVMERASVLKTRIAPAEKWQEPTVEPLEAIITAPYRSVVLIIALAVLILFLVACANGAALLLTRAVSRRAEMALRICLGATRRQLARQLTLESFVLSVLAAVPGIVVAGLLTELIGTIGASKLPRLADVELNWPALGFAAGLGLISGLLVSLVPTFRSLRIDLTPRLGENRFGGVRQRFRNGLVGLEVACSLVVLVSATTAGQALYRVLSIDTGIRPEGVLTARWMVTGSGPSVQSEAARFSKGAIEALRRGPGVEAVGEVNDLPLSGRGSRLALDLNGTPAARRGSRYMMPQRRWVVAGEYFRAMGIPLISGRIFSDSDDEMAPRVMLINRSMAREVWGNEDPVGKEVVIAGETKPRTVVGVVGDVRPSLTQAPGPQFYLSRRQNYRDVVSTGGTIVIRMSGRMTAALQRLRGIAKSLHADVSLSEVRPMEELISDSIASTRVTAFVVSCLAGLAFLVTLTGLYALVSYSAATRTREIAIRMALGGSRMEVLVALMREGAMVVGLGAALGLIGTWPAGRLLSSLLRGVRPPDTFTLAVATALVVVVTLASALRPAVAATTRDPLQALRYE